MSEKETQKRAPLLDPISRVSEIIFGLIMTLSFTGSISAATAGREEIRTMLFAALGCNLAWGLVDAVIYTIVTLTERTRNLTLVRRIRGAVDANDAQAILADALPGRLGAIIGTEGLEHMRRSLIAQPEPRAYGRLGWDDIRSAIGVFFLVVLATFPVVIPFIVISETLLAMRVSNAVALAMLFAAGYSLGRHSGGIPWRFGFAMATIGAFLVATTIALGG